MARRKNYINRIHIMIEFAALAVWLVAMILAVTPISTGEEWQTPLVHPHRCLSHPSC